jgi:hypothetical protein
MAGERYNDPCYGNKGKMCLGRITPTASGAANEIIARFRSFTKVKLQEIRACIMVAGKADTSAFTVFKGTSSIGQVTLGTNAAGSVVDASLTDTDFEATDDLILKNALATDTGSAFMYVQYQEQFT